MAEQKIQLRKLRDFGENFNDTFLFLRQNLKPLLKSFFAIASVFMVGLAIFTGLYKSRAFSNFASILTGSPGNFDLYKYIFSFEYLMMIVFMWLTFITMEVVLGAYFKYYLENDGKRPEIDDVWALFKRYFLRIFLYSIPIFLVTIIGTLFCVATWSMIP